MLKCSLRKIYMNGHDEEISHICINKMCKEYRIGCYKCGDH